MKRLMTVLLTATLSAPILFACGADDEVDRTVDCAEICDKYSDCVTDLDVTDCTDYCEDQADADENVEQRVDACDECIEGKSCAEAASCIPSCALVPVQ